VTVTGFDPTDIEMHLVTDFASLTDFMVWIHSGHSFMALDIETDGLNWYDGKIRLVQFGSLNRGYAIPFDRFKGPIREALDFLKSKGTLLLGHNISAFDLTWLRRHCGFEPDWSKVHDSQTLAALYDTAGPRSLKQLATAYITPFAAQGQKELQEDMRKYKLTWATVPVELPSYWVYGVMDTILTAHLFFELYDRCQRLGHIQAYNTECHVSKILHNVSWRGIAVDLDHVHNESVGWRLRLEELAFQARMRYGVENLGSPAQLTQAFLANGVELSMKTPTGKWRMDADALTVIAAMNEDSDLVKLVTEYRMGQKYNGTYYEQLRNCTRSDGRIHPYYRQVAARTLRMSASEPAIQTWPRDPVVRDSLVAAEGHKLISADFSNMEARIFACLAPDPGMIQAFRDGVDLHCYTGGLMYNNGVPIDKKDPRRSLSKNSLFATLFGGGAEVVAVQAGISVEKAAETQATLLRAFPSIKSHNRAMKQEAAMMMALDKENNRHGIRLFDGRVLRLSGDDDRTYAYQNYQIQGTARLILAHSLVALDNAGVMDYGVAVIHDEIVVEVPTDLTDDVRHAIGEYMPNDELLALPISVGIGNPCDRFGQADH
jgi:DNA polymerase I